MMDACAVKRPAPLGFVVAIASYLFAFVFTVSSLAIHLGATLVSVTAFTAVLIGSVSAGVELGRRFTLRQRVPGHRGPR